MSLRVIFFPVRAPSSFVCFNMAEQSEVSSPPEDVTEVTDNATVHSDSQTEEPKEESVCEEGKATSCGVTEEVDTSRPVQQTEQLKKTTLFTPADLFRFRQLLVSTTEKLRRLETAEEKNESRIQELVVSNHTLNREKEDLLQQLKLKEQEYEQRLEDLRHECEDRLHRADVDKTSSEVKKKVTKEMQNRMKEELKQMQVKAYQQDKQISELQSQLASHHNSSDVALAHWTQMDVRLKELGGQYLKAAESLARLERGVDFARQVAKGLSYQVRHQQCEMRERTGQLVSVREEVIALRAQVTSRPVESFQVEEMRAQVEGMSRRVEQLEREREELTKELSRQTQRAQEALSSSQRAHEQIA
ncbi:golgin subfamily A member 6-like protein 22, partial [Aplysia californica]|uniref:Golgin subfamily A member 6-like protein 22 n=1 Tax=Aplysia californica TaxID=6500 RepID=A0ABM1W065_APLCA